MNSLFRFQNTRSQQIVEDHGESGPGNIQKLGNGPVGYILGFSASGFICYKNQDEYGLRIGKGIGHNLL
jgi:hypothetical protein